MRLIRRAPATHGGRLLASFLLFGLYMHPNRTLDLKIVSNQHPKPPNGITNIFRFSAHSSYHTVYYISLWVSKLFASVPLT